MKNFLSIFTLLVVSFIFLIGCNNSNNSASVSEAESTVTKTTVLGKSTNDETNWKTTTYEVVNNFHGVSITVKNETVSNNGLTVVFENNSNKMCIYGEEFLLEKKINGEWYQVPVAIEGNYGFKSIGYEVASGQTREWSVEWQWLYRSLGAGEYRIVKNVLDFRQPGDYDTYFLAAEFSIH